MKIRRKLTQTPAKQRSAVFEPYEEGCDSLLCKPGCNCRLCSRPKPRNPNQTIAKPISEVYETNFSFSVRNAYSFVLMHLKNDDNKNPLGLLIPDVCIFHESIPYDIYYSLEGHIRGFRTEQDQKIRRTDIPKVFKQLSSLTKETSNSKINIARFINNEYMMMSDNDLTQICFKSKSDSIWQKLEYFYNKIDVESYQPIIRAFSSLTQYPPVIKKLAAESLVGYIDDSEVRELLDEQSYLDYCNIKICDLLNYKHNIRVSKAEFSYLKTYSGSYVFINADHLEHSNLTQALKKRQQRLEKDLLDRNNRILLTPRREEKIKHMEKNPMVKVIQSNMNRQFEEKLKQLGLHSQQFSKNQEMRSELAFKKLHPLVTIQYKDLIQRSNFIQIKDKILGNNKRRPLIGRSKNKIFSFFEPVASNTRVPFRSNKKVNQSNISKQSKNIRYNHRRRMTTTTDFSFQSHYGRCQTQSDLQCSINS